jgi:hypothetical protein
MPSELVRPMPVELSIPYDLSMRPSFLRQPLTTFLVESFGAPSR